MDVLFHQPSGMLQSLVQSIWSGEENESDVAIPGLIAPDSHVEFVFHLSTQCQMQRAGSIYWEPQPQAMLYAQRSACVRLRTIDRASMVAFRTSAVVAGMILGRPMHDLWDTPIALRDVLGQRVETLADQLAAAPTLRRFELIENWLRLRLAPWSSDHASIERLHEQLVWRSNGETLRETAATLGVSVRSLRRWIAEATGLSPKQFQLSGRILRSCALLHERRDFDIAAIASELGFSDHAAFANVFREHTAMSPSLFRAEPLVFYEKGPR